MPGRGRGGSRRGRRGAPPARNQQGKYKEHDDETRKKALRMISGGQSLMTVSRLLGVPKTTLYRWHHNPDMVLGSGKTTVLSKGEEALIVCAFNFMADAGYYSAVLCIY